MQVTYVNRKCVYVLVGSLVCILTYWFLLRDSAYFEKSRDSIFSIRDWWRDGGKPAVLPPCPAQQKHLVGDIHIDTDEVIHISRKTGVLAGGHWQPRDCQPLQKVALIIPFQDPFHDRRRNLQILVRQLHTILQRQLLSYTIYVVKQYGSTGWFNKGMMMNVGFAEAEAESSYDCYIFHDVDLIPVDDRNMYTCDEFPRHMCSHINNKTVTYTQATGGVLAMTAGHFRKLNGFSNNYWGWGNEDDNMYDRIQIHSLKLLRSSASVGRYIHLKHKRTYKGTGYRPNNRNVNLVDGLNSLSSSMYSIIHTKYLPNFTWIEVNVTQP